MNKPSPYVKLASAEFAECRIERIFVRPRLRETIRFSDWRGGRFNKRALDLSEDELLVLIGDAIAARVFSPTFLNELGCVLGLRGSMVAKSGTGRTIYPKIGIWYAEEDGHIRMSFERQAPTSVSNDPKSERYHRTLYKKLAAILEEAGSPIPTATGGP